MPRERYTHAPEILEHCGRIGRQFDLYKNALFSTEILSLRYDETGMNWVIGTNKGDTIRAKYVVMSSGPLHKPKLAGIPGINSFKGISFHTSRWDYNVTGGSSKGNLDKLGDKVVGIIGTGATAVQCIPHLGASAKRLIVFQRTPSSIDLRENRPTDPEWARSLKPGWQKERMDNFERVVNGIQVEDMVRALGRFLELSNTYRETPLWEGPGRLDQALLGRVHQNGQPDQTARRRIPRVQENEVRRYPAACRF